jgi:hypothetical protein
MLPEDEVLDDGIKILYVDQTGFIIRAANGKEVFVTLNVLNKMNEIVRKDKKVNGEIMRMESFTFSGEPTFYGVGVNGFVEFTGQELATLRQIALECSNGERGNYPPNEVKLYEITIREIEK